MGALQAQNLQKGNGAEVGRGGGSGGEGDDMEAMLREQQEMQRMLASRAAAKWKKKK